MTVSISNEFLFFVSVSSSHSQVFFNLFHFFFLFLSIKRSANEFLFYYFYTHSMCLLTIRVPCNVVTFVQIMLINMRLSSLVSYLHAQSRSLLLKSICKRKSNAFSSFREVTVKFFIMGNTRYRVPD